LLFTFFLFPCQINLKPKRKKGFVLFFSKKVQVSNLKFEEDDMRYTQKLKWSLCSAFAFATIAFAGCGGSQAPTANTPTPVATASSAPAKPAPPPVSPAEAATITGKVDFVGTPPKPMKVSMNKEATCNTYNNQHPHYVDSVVVNPNHTLKYVFVYVKSGLPANMTFTPPSTQVTLDQQHCWYEPHVLGVMVGQPINVINSDVGVLHNIHFLPKLNPPVNFGQPGPQPGSPPPSKIVTFNKPEIIPVKCDVHSWMHAYVGVFPNPYFAVTNDKGEFTIKNLPPGTYTLEAWQEQYGTKDITVTVGKKQTKSVTFTFKG
jgi:plastocyanin